MATRLLPFPVCSCCPCLLIRALTHPLSLSLYSAYNRNFSLSLNFPSSFPRQPRSPSTPIARESRTPTATYLYHHAVATRTMKLFALLLLALVAIAAAVPAPHPDGPREVTTNSTGAVLLESIAEAQGKNTFRFTWATEEYCGDDGALRARGKWSTNGFHSDFEIDGTRSVWVEVLNKPLHMTYDFNNYGM
jgi:hypothetical protein